MNERVYLFIVFPQQGAINSKQQQNTQQKVTAKGCSYLPFCTDVFYGLNFTVSKLKNHGRRVG